MVYVLILSICVAGSCVDWKPEDDYVLFRDLETCRGVKEAIVDNVLSARVRKKVSAHGLCLLVEPNIGANDE